MKSKYKKTKTKTKKHTTTKIHLKTKRKHTKTLIHQFGSGEIIDQQFTSCYDDNIKKVMAAIEQYSGKHTIDSILATEFVDNQTSPFRREIAKSFIDNTLYITLAEVYDIVGQLIDNAYSELNNDDVIYLYSGMPEKSSYFLSVMALHHIKLKSYKEPVFIKSIDFDVIQESPLLMLDDVSYSGSQLSTQLKAIYYSQVYTKRANPPNIYILLIALNDVSKKLLSEVPSSARTDSTGKIYIDHLKPSPFKLIYLKDRLYKPLISILGIERFVYLKLLFAPWLCLDMNAGIELPCVSLYLDSKIADPVSTFTTTLIYGQIPPSNIDFSYFIESIENGGGSECLIDLEPTESARLLQETTPELKTHANCISLTKLIKRFITLDVTDKPSNIITFKPFINTCKSNTLLQDLINNEHVKQLDYLVFMIPQDCYINNDCSISYDVVKEYLLQKNYLVKQKYQVTSEKTNKLVTRTRLTPSEDGLHISDLHQQITSLKCPYSWYKKGPLQMICTMRGGNKKTRRNHIYT